jgi:hypothetical protein
MTRREFVNILLSSVAHFCYGQTLPRIAIVVSPAADPLERFAAAELSKYLEILYPQHEFRVRSTIPMSGTFVQLGTPQSFPTLSQYLPEHQEPDSDSFVVTTTSRAHLSTGIIVGRQPRGTLYAVYALLEQLGYRFYLSYEVSPTPKAGEFVTDTWNLSDSSLTPERIIFTWHNFLSGCSAWNLPEWKQWIDHAAKMRFNCVMVHAYGNNPMFSFAHNGQTKATGYLPTTCRGRDWGTEHVNDVRRLVGAQGGVFEGPVFGADAAMVSKEETVKATEDLMKQVFAFAKTRGHNVTFALDVDTEASNPQNIVQTLPEAATLQSRGFRIPNPDTPEGLGYYRSQVTQLLDTYPEIDRVVLWFRRETHLWGGLLRLRVDELPTAWENEFRRAAEKHPEIVNAPHAPGLCALSRIVAAYRNVLDDIGKANVQLGIGSWGYDFLPSADVFMTPDTNIVCIDQFNVLAGSSRDIVRKVSLHRKVIPIPYAQDDDDGYLGRPYTPFSSWASLLRESGSAGFGILHWTTRPLDLYFKSLSVQVWRSTENQSLETACDDLAGYAFGSPARRLGAQYLLRWIKEAPMFGRETTDRLIDRPLSPVDRVISECEERLQLLAGMQALDLSSEGAKQLSYFLNWEHFVMDFYATQAAWERSTYLSTNGEIDDARQAVMQCKPERVIEQYARTISCLDRTSGDKGILISLNLRWLPYIVSQRQALGKDAVRIKFQPTNQEALAQLPGHYTFFLDQDRQLWLGMGDAETGGKVIARDTGPGERLYDSALHVTGPTSLRLGSILAQKLAPGPYVAKLLFAPPLTTSDNVVDVMLRGSDGGSVPTRRVTIDAKSEGDSKIVWMNQQIDIMNGYLQLSMDRVKGDVLLCGVILVPITQTGSTN